MAGAYTKWKNGIQENLDRVYQLFPRLKDRPASMPGLSREESGRCWLLGSTDEPAPCCW